MEKKMNKFGVEKLLAVLAVAFACVCMWGCSDDVSFEWERTRRNAKIIGFVDDSLVMVGDYRFWLEVTDSWNGEHLEESGAGNPRLCVYNYRVQEEGPRWCDSVAERNNSGRFGGQMTDSIIWGGDFTAKMRMWKIGERPHEIALARRVEDGCSGKFKITSIKQWMDGTFIARGDKSLTTEGNGCQYAVLDTMARTLTFKRLEKSLEWIKECDDVRAWDKDVYCFMPGERAFEAVLLQNGKDTVDVPIKFTIGDFWGDVLRPNANLCNFIDDKLFCSGVEWRGGLEFYKDGKVVVDLK
ncbi:MAG: hypothetical protein SPL52_08945 [Fibrobacter sp.]|nr:hypothetical protein [Fibrobacter sp.]